MLCAGQGEEQRERLAPVSGSDVGDGKKILMLFTYLRIYAHVGHQLG